VIRDEVIPQSSSALDRLIFNGGYFVPNHLDGNGTEITFLARRGKITEAPTIVGFHVKHALAPTSIVVLS
jgi:hypothetical protein